MEDTDAPLVRRAQRGDERAFTELVERYQPDCLRFASQMLRCQADAEEVVQDSFVRAYRALPRYEHRGQLRPWLFRILVNQCRTRAAASRRHQVHLGRYENELAVDGGAPAPGSAAAAETLLFAEEVHHALTRLPPDQREAFLLKYVQELSYQEIARITGVGVSALKMRAKRGLERLRSELRERSGDDGLRRAAR